MDPKQPLPSLDGKVHRDVKKALEDLRRSHDTLVQTVSGVMDQLSKGVPVTNTMLTSIQTALTSTGSHPIRAGVANQVGPNGVVVPAVVDPKIKGAVWNNNGVLTISAG